MPLTLAIDQPSHCLDASAVFDPEVLWLDSVDADGAGLVCRMVRDQAARVLLAQIIRYEAVGISRRGERTGGDVKASLNLRRRRRFGAEFAGADGISHQLRHVKAATHCLRDMRG